jgi:serine protease AprX
MNNPYLLTALLTTIPGLVAAKDNVAPDLKETPAHQVIRVIVRWNGNPSEAAERKVIARGGRKISGLSLIRAGLYEIEAGSARDLASDPDVRSVHPNRSVYATAVTMRPDFGWAAALDSQNLNVPFNGTGIGIAMVDSGIVDREDLMDARGHTRIVYSQSLISGDNTAADTYGHGTHVAGLLAGNGRKSTGSRFDYTVQGLASNANLISLRVLDTNGMSDDATVIAAIDRAVQLKNTYNIRVMNLSLGRPVAESYLDDPLCAAVQRAWDAGIVVVVAAGNNGRDNTADTNGYGTITSPGNSPYVITVGAMNTQGTLDRADDIVTSYTSKGPTMVDHIAKPDLVAPGNKIISLRDSGSFLDTEYRDNRVPMWVYATTTANGTPDYYVLSGTSMAAALVSGAAAILIQQDPTLSPDQVKARLMRTASKFPQMSSTSFDPDTGYQWTSQYDIFTIGAGYLDVNAALADTIKADGTAQSPVVAYDDASGDVYLVEDLRSVWGQSEIWAERSVWGTAAVWGTRSVWGLSAVWGDSLNAGFQNIWSDRSVWGTRSTWGTDIVNAGSVMINGDE